MEGVPVVTLFVVVVTGTILLVTSRAVVRSVVYDKSGVVVCGIDLIGGTPLVTVFAVESEGSAVIPTIGLCERVSGTHAEQLVSLIYMYFCCCKVLSVVVACTRVCTQSVSQYPQPMDVKISTCTY